MPAVFVHGNPETEAVWRPLRGALDRDDLVCLSPPGFGAPVPEGWGATRGEYVAWLIGELSAIDGPVDLVGHDWGGGHVMGAVVSRPDLVRSWCCDVLGLFHPDYVWHDLAQVWRTPDAGERAVAEMLGAPIEGRVALFEGFGIPPDVARDMAEGATEEMGRCILALYRSADPADLATVGEQLPRAAERPGLAIVASEDGFVGTESMAREMAERAGAEVAVLEGLGHWWMCQDPERGAAALSAFWRAL